jgi:hypothetical protein
MDRMDKVSMFLIGGVAINLMTAFTWVVMNTKLVTRLRRFHPELYQSIGAPGIWWNKYANKSAVMWFVLGSRWANVNDPSLARLCRRLRATIVLHFAAAGAGLLTVAGCTIHGIVS